MLDVNSLDLGDVIVLDVDSISNATGKVYLKGTEVEVVGFTKKDSSSRPAKGQALDITLRYPDGEQALVSGVADILTLVARRFHKKTKADVLLVVGDVFDVTKTLVIKHCGKTIHVDTVEAKLNGLQENNINLELLDVHGNKYLYSCAVDWFINEIAVKNVKLRNKEKQEVKRIDIYSDRTTPQVGDIIVSCDVDDLNMVNNVYGVVVDKVDRIKTGWLCEFEGTLVQDIPKMTQHIVSDWAFKDGAFKIVNHRNVPEDFIPYKEVQEVEYVKTGDFMGVIGKKYFIQGGTGYIEVICIEEDENPMCIDANTFGYIGDMQFNELYEKKNVTKNIPIAPTASVTLG